jgi:hypothetical protein
MGEPGFNLDLVSSIFMGGGRKPCERLLDLSQERVENP